MAAALEDKGGRRSMAAGAFNGSNDGQLQDNCKAAGAKRKTQKQQSNEGGGSLWTPSDAFRHPKHQWRGICGMSTMVPQQSYKVACFGGSGGGASMGCRWQHIVVGEASAVPSGVQASGGGIGGITSVERWWGCCWGGGIVGALAASNASNNHQRERQRRVVVAEPQVDGRQRDN